MQGKSIGELKVGDKVSVTRAFSEQDVAAFAQVSGDHNPAHMDEEYAKGTMFKTRIVHGMLVGSLFSALLGTELPGVGSIYTGQTLKFTKPVHFGEEITASVTVKEIIAEKNRVILDCLAVNPQGEPVILGEATIMPPRK
ncbi:MAG: MaoC family dehydratase [Clostridiales bacterium]|nr:MaoC family dehydratase [Clostridiales bacterium]